MSAFQPGPGDTLGGGRFRVEGVLGRGASSMVFRVHDKELGRDVALKALHDSDADWLYRLKREFRRLAGLRHPNLIRLHELIASEEDCFFTMELLEGRDLLTAVRGDAAAGEFDADMERRLRDSFRQLVIGLQALHGAGQLHRDVKPGNVYVLPDGRTVLLDFGLAAPLRRDSLDSRSEALAGTLDYMAPEVVWGRPPDEAADWYSVGVTLFEALCGERPHAGSVAEIVEAKRKDPPPSPRERCHEVPEALDRLARDLLDADPRRRPGAAELLEVLGEVAPAGPEAVPAAPRGPEIAFVGREAELRQLDAALAASDAGPRLLHVRGPSGIGKSELVRRFLARHREPDGGAPLVLGGRCHPQESVPFKALDPVVDDLSRHLMQLERDAVMALAPRHAGALLRLFPVLGRVPGAARWPQAQSTIEPHELRHQGFQALREVLARLCDERPLVLWIDDAQWGDRDSASGLQDLLRPPDAPGLLLLLSYRSEDAPGSALLEQLARENDRLELPSDALDLGPLGKSDARTLAGSLLGTAADATLHRIAEESAGNPFFVGELSRHLARTPDARSLRVADVVSARLGSLPEDARSLLELVAVSGRPTDLDLVLDLAGVGPGGRPVVYDLCDLCLLRAGASDEQSTVETYHDRIRETVLDGLGDEARRSRHRQLADGLRAGPAPDPQRLAEHYMGAGARDLAARFALEGADQASVALAFERAADLYALHLALRGERDTDWGVQVKRAEALAGAGRSADAGRAYETAAERAENAGADRETAASLRGRAAEQYLYGGRVSRGLEVLRGVLRDLGLSVPLGRRAAMRSAIGLRLRFWARGSRFVPREGASIPRSERVRLDALWGGAKGAANAEYTLSDALHMRHLLGALAAGERSRVLRALALEAPTEANVGGWLLNRSADRLIDQADLLAGETGDPYDRAWTLANRGLVHWMRAEWRPAAELIERAMDTFRSECTGVEWEIAVTQTYGLSALAQLGRLRELSERHRQALDDARRRGDMMLQSTLLAGDSIVVPLARDEAAAAVAEANRVLVSVVTERPSTAHIIDLVGVTQAHLYSGEPERAWQCVEARWSALESAKLLRLAYFGAQLRFLRARAALAFAAAGGSDRWSPERLRRVARGDRRGIARRRLICTAPMLAVIDAAFATLDGRERAAASAWRRAVAGFDRADMALHREAARLRLEAFGDETAGARSRQWMAREGIRRPDAMARALVPG